MSTPPISGDVSAKPETSAPFVRHALFSIALWITFVVYWNIVLGRGVAGEAGFTIVLLFFFVVLQVFSTLAWVAHNQGISERHQGRRRLHPVSPALTTRDFLGRLLQAYPEDTDLTTAPVVTVRVEGEVKRLETGLPFGEVRSALGK